MKSEKEGTTGIEPMTSGTAIQYSTIELHPLIFFYFIVTISLFFDNIKKDVLIHLLMSIKFSENKKMKIK